MKITLWIKVEEHFIFQNAVRFSFNCNSVYSTSCFMWGVANSIQVKEMIRSEMH